MSAAELINRLLDQGLNIRPVGKQTVDALRGGWMHTGDMRQIDVEGYVTVVDRLKDMIITGGENVYSAEVENTLSLHRGVQLAAVIAVPSAKWGETVHAVIRRRDSALTLETLDVHCRARLAGYKVPRSFAFVNALPVSVAGKVLKNVLRDEWRAMPLEDGVHACAVGTCNPGEEEFSPEFKDEAVALLKSSGRPVTRAASKVGISPSMLRHGRAAVRGGSTRYRLAAPPR